MSDFAQEGGHYYLPSGEPFYTVVGANGVERPATLRDARKVGAFPGTTGIIRCAAAPALEKWKRNQLLLAALTLPRMPGETETNWLDRVEQDWQKEGRAAADRGTAIHGAIEKHYRGEIPDDDLWPWVKAAKEAVEAHCGPQEWSAERSFAHLSGYGGKVDLRSPEWVIDVKGKAGDGVGSVVYDEHFMQLAAYRQGLRIPRARCAILFVGRDVASASFVEVPEKDLEKGLQMFTCLLGYWQAKTGHKPEGA